MSPLAGTLSKHDAYPTEAQARAEAWLIAESAAKMVALHRPGFVRSLLPPVEHKGLSTLFVMAVGVFGVFVGVGLMLVIQEVRL